MAKRITDAQCQRVEKELTAALIALYLSGKQAALSKLDKQLEAELTPEQRTKIEQFAAKRAALIQAGTNQYLDNAGNDLGKDQTPEQIQQAESDRLKKVAEYNAGVLIPFLALWAANNATVDTYQEQGAADSQQWFWQQNTDFIDDCTEAEAASPATLDELIGIGGGIPPIHANCQCTLEPV